MAGGGRRQVGGAPGGSSIVAACWWTSALAMASWSWAAGSPSAEHGDDAAPDVRLVHRDAVLAVHERQRLRDERALGGAQVRGRRRVLGG